MADNLVQDPLVTQLIADPSKSAPPTLMLVGFLGKDTNPANWRVYLTPRLTEYMTIAAAEIVNSEPLSTAESPEGGTRLWVNASALENISVTSTQPQVDFVRGDIMEAPGGYTTELVHMMQQRAQAGPGIVMGFTIPIIHCTLSFECLHSITFCEIMCHTLLGGYTCKVYKRGHKLHDSLDVWPCAYSLGNDPGCKEHPLVAAPPVVPRPAPVVPVLPVAPVPVLPVKDPSA